MKQRWIPFLFLITISLVLVGTTGMKHTPSMLQSRDTTSRSPKPDTVLINTSIDRLTRAIEGKVDSPAVQVFQNVQVFKKLPAGRFLGLMKGWTRTLGVDCSHCHTVDQWEKDDKLPKQTARAMDKMVDDINSVIKGIKSIQDDRARISCWTCHRGQTKPETNPFRAERREGTSPPQRRN